MNIFDLEAKITAEFDISKSENAKHFERIKNLLEEVISEIEKIQYSSSIKDVTVSFPTTAE